MELRNLHAFVEIVRCGGFSSAADVLCKSQPAVSRALMQLEKELGTVLIVRSPEGIELTVAGKLVHQRAVKILDECHGLRKEIEQLRSSSRQRLRLGLPVMGGSLLFASIYARFRELYPGVEVLLVERDTAELPQAVLDGEVDLAFTIRPFQQDFASVDACDEPAVVAMQKNNPLAGRVSVSIADLAGEPLIMPDPATAAFGLITRAFVRRGLQPNTVASSRQLPFILALVAQGMGASIIPRLWAEYNLGPDVVAVPLAEPEVRWQGCFIWQPGTRLCAGASAWVEMVAEAVQGRCPAGRVL